MRVLAAAFTSSFSPRTPAFAATAGAANPFALGERIFADPSLSASGAISCATCHDPRNAHAQSNDLAVQLGSPSLDNAGTRAVPSRRYLALTPAFAMTGDGPVGGFDRDGRAPDLMM
jgi:cytochrome c peroxidase